MSDASGVAQHPEIWAFSELLRAAGGEVDEALALGVCGGAGLIGLAFRDTRAQRSILHLSGWNPFQTNLMAGFERLGVPAVVVETSRRRKAATNLERAVEEGMPAAVWLDRGTLGLGPAVLRGVSPTVVVVRADGSGAFAVSEGPQAAATVDRDLLTAARLASPAHRNRVVTLAPGGGADLAQVYRRGLAATAVGPVGGPPGGTGSDALRGLAESLVAEGPGSWADTFPGDAELTRSLVALHTAISGEGALLRRAQAAFTDRAARAVGLPGLGDLATDYADLAGRWQELAEAALPADVPELAELRATRSPWELPAGVEHTPFPLAATEQDALRRGLAARLSSLADQEQATLERLRAVLSSA